MSDDLPGWRPPTVPYVEEAMSAEAVVVEERRRWCVYLDVVLASGAVRRKVGEYHDERRALHAARIIERNARRCITRPMSASTLPEPARLAASDPSEPTEE
jgi:hypothetical protein